MKDEPKPSKDGKGNIEPSHDSGWRYQQQLALRKAVESADRGDFANPEEVERFFRSF